METLEVEKQNINNILPQINQNGYLDLSKYDRIPALDRAIAEPDEPEEFYTIEEYIRWQNSFLNENEDE